MRRHDQDGHHSAWTTVAALVTVLGACVAVERLGLSVSATFYLLSAMLVAALAAALQPEDAPKVWRASVRPGVVGGAAALGTFGMVFLLGPVALLILPAGVLASPPGRRWWRRRFGGGPRFFPTPGPHGLTHTGEPDPASVAATTTVPIPDSPTSPPEYMSDADLCRAWRRSYALLKRSGSVNARLMVVQQRQRYLDELERRNPWGLSVWLCSGARAASDPSRYIRQRADPGNPPAA
jgi:hypothetical protein